MMLGGNGLSPRRYGGARFWAGPRPQVVGRAHWLAEVGADQDQTMTPSSPVRGMSSNSNGLSTVAGEAVITACLLAASDRGQPWGGGAGGRPGGAR